MGAFLQAEGAIRISRGFRLGGSIVYNEAMQMQAFPDAGV